MADAYTLALRMLARRELSEAQLRERLARRDLDADDIDAAVRRLLRDGALDDRRTALAFARTHALVKRRGRLRVLRELEAIGISRSAARAAVDEVFAEVDEDAVIARVLDRRIRSGTPTEVRRARQYLLRQGFSGDRVREALRQRQRRGPST